MKSKKINKFTEQEIVGVVQGHRDGHGFIQPDDGGADVYIAPNEMRAVLHKDRVRARIVRVDRKGRPEGRVTEIVQRSSTPIMGRLLQEHGVWLLAPEDKRYGQDILLPKDALAGAKAGQVVVVELTEAPALYGQPVGRVTEVLGEVDDPGMEIEIAVRKYGVPHVFSEACVQAAQALPATVQPADLPGRVDLTDVPLVTIDGEDARDFDDAVYCEPAVLSGRGKSAKKGWRLLVAIADVSHYVKNNSPIDIDAYDRATSVYFPRRVIPMLPEKLSNGLCSLNPEVHRLCMVCDMLVTEQGELHAYQFYPAVMFSHARFTYTQVADILTNTQGHTAQQFPERVPDLLNLYGVYQALLQQRHVRGAVDLDTVETQIVSDDNGRIEKIIPRVRNEAHKLIEEAMLAANVCAAHFIEVNKRSCLYRVHDAPSPEKIDILRQFLRTMGVSQSVSDEPATREFAAIAEATKDRPDHEQIHTMLLRSMQQAMYTPHNNGHFGLAFEAYTHFTSPIRRYPDLLVHRTIKAILNGEKYALPKLPLPGEAHEKLTRRMEKAAAARGEDAAKPRRKATAEIQAWEAAGLHCSANERRADEASRDVEAWLKCKYMRDFLGEEFDGVVSTATSFGLFVTLNAMYVEGLVHITELGGDYFKFDERRQELIGERSGVRFGLGTPVRIQVVRVDLDSRKIDFRLVRAGDGSAIAPRKPSSQRASKRTAGGSEAEFAEEEVVWHPKAKRKPAYEGSTMKLSGAKGSTSKARTGKSSTRAVTPSVSKPATKVKKKR